ncbi:hypothetical protein CHS0354_013962, partial [Potamilus streckersoni]
CPRVVCVCVEHLCFNASKYLEDSVGYALQHRQNITRLIFGKDGIVDYLFQTVSLTTYSARFDRLHVETDIRIKGRVDRLSEPILTRNATAS